MRGGSSERMKGLAVNPRRVDSCQVEEVGSSYVMNGYPKNQEKGCWGMYSAIH